MVRPPARPDRRRTPRAVLLTVLGLVLAGLVALPAPAYAADGDLVTYGGRTYRIAGGAPIVIPTTTLFDTETKTALTTTAWNALARYPRNRTFIRGHPSGRIYSIAWGAPLYVSSAYWATLTTKPPVYNVDDLTISRISTTAPYDRLLVTPPEGSFITGQLSGDPDHNTVYKIAGGAPIFVSDWDNVGAFGPTVGVDVKAVQNAGASDTYRHLNALPVDGTVLEVAGRRYVTSGGAPVPSMATTPGIVIDPVAVANAGQPGRWSHLRPIPADPVPPDTQITSGPSGTVTATTLTYTFAADEPSTFECRWDGGGWSPCASPYAASVPPGPHAFETRAVDWAGNVDPTPAARGVVVAGAAVARMQVKAKAIKKRSRLKVDLGPDSATANYRFTVLKKAGKKWKKVARATKIKTKGAKDVRVLELKRGRYRVKVPAQRGLAGAKSGKVRLRR